MLNAFDILTLTSYQKQRGIWLSRISGEGEFKRWHSNGQLYEHSFWKNGEREGECKTFYRSGEILDYYLYENGKIVGICHDSSFKRR